MFPLRLFLVFPWRMGPIVAVAACVLTAQPPDILLLMPDQMRGDALSAVGHPVVRTPTFDRLAAQGALFRRAYATSPSCIPARLSLLTGTFPATSGLVGYAPFRITRPTLPARLAQAGYATVLVGRNMHQNPPRLPADHRRAQRRALRAPTGGRRNRAVAAHHLHTMKARRNIAVFAAFAAGGRSTARPMSATASCIGGRLSVR
ncbi:MAG: sulfatase-like hydrolase/transferase [Opitutaceae bacterium]|nr:sulfatase-like hydrolase/transferase [Opitutaceae bacterium]